MFKFIDSYSRHFMRCQESVYCEEISNYGSSFRLRVSCEIVSYYLLSVCERSTSICKGNICFINQENIYSA